MFFINIIIVNIIINSIMITTTIFLAICVSVVSKISNIMTILVCNLIFIIIIFISWLFLTDRTGVAIFAMRTSLFNAKCYYFTSEYCYFEWEMEREDAIELSCGHIKFRSFQFLSLIFIPENVILLILVIPVVSLSIRQMELFLFPWMPPTSMIWTDLHWQLPVIIPGQ